MPQHEVGYRAWNGKRTSQAGRWWIIAETGFQAALRSPWVRRLLFVAWLPIFYWGTIFFVLENVLTPPEFTRTITEQLDFDKLEAALDEDGESRLGQIANRRKAREFEQDFERLKNSFNDKVRSGLTRRQRAIYDQTVESNAKQVIENFRDYARRLEENASDQIKPLEEDVRELQMELARRARNREFARRFGWVPGTEKLMVALGSNDKEAQRHIAWSILLMTFFRYPQATMIIFLLGIISPGLISRDIRSRAYLIYFSKPIGRMEYIIGKLAIPSVFLLLVTTLPALCLYALGVSLSPDLSVFFSTWDIPLRIVLASFVLIIPTACLSLMLSSLTSESRFATFAWFAVWILGHGAWMGIWLMQAIRLDGDPITALKDPIVSAWSPLSLYNNLGVVQSWIFGLSDAADAVPGLVVLSLIMFVSIVVLFRKVSAPVRV